MNTTPQTYAQGTHPNTQANLRTQTDKLIEDKRALQRKFVDALIGQARPGQWRGVRVTREELGIPLGTYYRWLSDADFVSVWDEWKMARREGLSDILFDTIFSLSPTGTAIAKLGYVMGVLNKTDPEFADKLNVSGQIGTVHVHHGIPRPALTEGLPVGQLDPSHATVEQE